MSSRRVTSSAKRSADLPFVPEWIDDPTKTPTVFVGHRRRLGGARRERPSDHRLGVVDDEKRPACRAVDRARAKTFQRR